MKKGLTILVLVVGSAAMLSAFSRGNGRDDRFDRDDRRGMMYEERGGRMEELLDDEPRVTVTGKLKLVNGELPVLTSGTTSYTLMAPYNQLIDLGVKDGQTVTLEGVEFNAPMMWDGKEKSFVVEKITIAGKTTEIDHDDFGGMMGFGMGGRGNGGFGFQNRN